MLQRFRERVGSWSRLSWQIAIAGAASVLGAYVLTQVNLGQYADRPLVPATLSMQPVDALSSAEERVLTREVLKARRQNAQAPAEVKPTATDRQVIAKDVAPEQPERTNAPAATRTASAAPVR